MSPAPREEGCGAALWVEGMRVSVFWADVGCVAVWDSVVVLEAGLVGWLRDCWCVGCGGWVGVDIVVVLVARAVSGEVVRVKVRSEGGLGV